LTENDSRTMSSLRFTAKKTTTKILGEGKYGKPKAPTIFFQLHLYVNITWITGHIHRSIVDKIDPTSEDVEMGKKTPYQLHWVTYFCEMWSEEFI
jgi:hypothetical protein